jgi:hypothetical protein
MQGTCNDVAKYVGMFGGVKDLPKGDPKSDRCVNVADSHSFTVHCYSWKAFLSCIPKTCSDKEFGKMCADGIRLMENVCVAIAEMA